MTSSVIKEGEEYIGESGKTYLAVGALGQANVWTAVDKGDHSNIVVLKGPASDDTETSWPRFQHEMIMHELLKDCASVRRQVDRIPPVKDANSPPLLVLEIFETTLWSARTKRPFTKSEIQNVVTSILRGLQEIHEQGLVFADLKMQNVMLNGFAGSDPGDGSEMVAKLGDLGIVMYPAKGKVQPVAYRAPEVFFKGEITQAADMWAFGLVYCHLLEAQSRFSKTGLYDDLNVGSGSMPEREQAMRHAMANDYDIENVEYFKDVPTPYRDDNHGVGQHWDELRKRGLDEKDIMCLKWVLNPDPSKRPTAKEALDSRWFKAGATEEEKAAPPPQLDGTIEAPLAENKSNRSSAKRRRDADSCVSGAPDSIKLPPPRPEALMRGISQAVFTPGAATPGPQAASKPSPLSAPTGDNAGDTLHERDPEGQTSSNKEHPLMTNTLSPGSAEVQEGTSKLQVSDTPEGGAERYLQPDKPEDPVGVFEEAASKVESSAGAEDVSSPPRPAYLGRNSSKGGTFLSYQ